jgi:OFA family oxalate/formate antiporter-like MFS transporter
LSSLINIKKYSKIYYGYVVIAAAFIIITLMYGAQGCFGVFFKPISGEFGWSRAETAGPFALCMVVSGFLSIFSGRLGDRFGCRKLVSIGGFLFGLGYILMSRITNLWQLYLFYLPVAVGVSTLYVPVVSLIARWFSKRRGLISGISTSGVGVGIVVMPPICSQIIESFGWRIPLEALGITLIVLIVPLGQLLKNAPENGKLPISRGNLQKPVLETVQGITFYKALRMSPFWLISIAWMCYGFFYQTALVHIVPYATDIGMSAISAATILMIIGITGTIGRFTLGYVADRIGNMFTTYASCGIIGLCYIGLLFSTGLWTLYLFAIIFGYVVAFGLLLIPIMAEYFGLMEVGIISGFGIFTYYVGGALGPLTAGGIFDSAGSYHWAFAACAAAGLIGALLIWAARVVHKPQY